MRPHITRVDAEAKKNQEIKD